MNNNDYIYYKLKDQLLDSLESDEFYEVFNNSIKAGKNSFSLYQKLINNVIDPKWVKAIEDCIIPIDNIIRHPIGFISQEHEIVPIEQTKKISQEAIRHLAQHTNMISKVEADGSVTPKKLLNVYKEETFATYENRFIYTLLKHLQYFIDKRLRILKEQKIQAENKVKVESEFNIGKEKVQYEFSLTSIEKVEKNKKDFKLDEDTSQMDLLQRVERLRMIMYDFQNSQLIRSLEGCMLVKPPIMRTNMILKNPNFKKALELWIFIESYNDAGLSIQYYETEELPSDIYISEMFSVALINYCLFNHYVKPDKALKQTTSLQKEFKPKLIRRTVEEYVNDLSMDIDEIERIFVDQVKRATKQRKDTEKKIQKAIERAIEKEKENNKKLAELAKQRKEEAKILAKKRREEAIVRNKLRKEEDKLRIKNNIKQNMDAIIALIKEKYTELDLEVNKHQTAFIVYSSKHPVIRAKFNDKAGIVTFRASKQFFDYVEKKTPSVLIKENIEGEDDWYKIIDKGDLNFKELQAIVIHSIKYVHQIQERLEKKLLEQAEKQKKIKKDKKGHKIDLQQAKVQKHLNEIKKYVEEKYTDMIVIESSDYSFKICRNKKTVAVVRWTNNSYRVMFQRKKTSAEKLMSKYPNLVTKTTAPKGEQWYKLLNRCDIKLSVIYSLIDVSYEYSISEEARIKAEKLKAVKAKKEKK